MTRDQWLTKCAERLRDKMSLEAGEAAAYAAEMHRLQVVDNGREPARWDDPVEAADTECEHMAHDEDASNEK